MWPSLKWFSLELIGNSRVRHRHRHKRKVVVAVVVVVVVAMAVVGVEVVVAVAVVGVVVVVVWWWWWHQNVFSLVHPSSKSLFVMLLAHSFVFSHLLFPLHSPLCLFARHSFVFFCTHSISTLLSTLFSGVRTGRVRTSRPQGHETQEMAPGSNATV